MKEHTSVDLLDSVRAAPPDPTCVTVAVRGNNVPWACGEHPDLGRSHNLLGDHLLKKLNRGEVSPPPSPPPVEYPMPELVSRQRDKKTRQKLFVIYSLTCLYAPTEPSLVGNPHRGTYCRGSNGAIAIGISVLCG